VWDHLTVFRQTPDHVHGGVELLLRRHVSWMNKRQCPFISLLFGPFWDAMQHLDCAISRLRYHLAIKKKQKGGKALRETDRRSTSVAYLADDWQLLSRRLAKRWTSLAANREGLPSRLSLLMPAGTLIIHAGHAMAAMTMTSCTDDN